MGDSVVGVGVDGVVASGRAGSAGVGGSGVMLPGSFPTPEAPLPDESNGVRPLLSTRFGRGGGTGVSTGGALPGGESSEPELGFGDELPGVPACASRTPFQAGAAVVRAVTVEISAATGRFAAATSSMGIGCTNSITPPC